jgi:hypothetical protein
MTGRLKCCGVVHFVFLGLLISCYRRLGFVCCIELIYITDKRGLYAVMVFLHSLGFKLSGRIFGQGLLTSAFAVLAGVAFCQGLSPQEAKITDLSGNPVGLTTPGQEFLFHMPVKNVTSATQTNAIGVAVPLTDGMDVVNPVSNYGDVAVGETEEGSPFRGTLSVSENLRRLYEVKVGLKSDQGQQDTTIKLPGNTGFGNGSQLAAWPTQSFASANVAAAAGADAAEVLVNSTAGVLGGSLYKNQRTGELIHVRTVEPTGNKLLIKRGQFGGVNPAPLEAGDSLVFEGVPIPDATAAGVAFKVPVTAVPGPVGNIRLKIESIVHPRVGDLMISVEDGASTPVLVLAPLEGGMARGADMTDVTFVDSATTSAEAQMGRLAAGEYQPFMPLSTVANTDGTSVTSWTVRVSDIAAPTVGYVKGWSLEPAP